MNIEERPEDAARRLATELLATRQRAYVAELDRNVAQAAVIDATQLITEMLSEFTTMQLLGWVPVKAVDSWRERAVAIKASVAPEHEGGNDK